jgi:alkanesulfonate monooxygenase SsuD/methylene tetrahydromethanopterin reductase-like flavin-dependent oxidoreductase (luciferase family)
MNANSRKFKLERRLNFGNAHEMESRGGLKRVLTPPDWTSIPGQVKDAEDLGYDTLLTAEIPLDPYFPLVLASQVPSRMTLGTGIAVALSRSPVPQLIRLGSFSG